MIDGFWFEAGRWAFHMSVVLVALLLLVVVAVIDERGRKK